MKRAHKTILGVFGLVLVVAMAFFAANIKTPETSAVSSTTDSIVVRVVSSIPKINFIQPGKNLATAEPNLSFKIDYSYVESIEFTMVYTNKDGVSRAYKLSDSSSPDYNPSQTVGTLIQSINLDNYGTGTFVFTVKGTGADKIVASDTLTIKYAPIVTNVEINPGTGESESGKPGDAVITVDYNDEEVDAENSVVKICINGNEKCFEYDVEDIPQDGKIIIPSDELKPGDTISVEVIAHDKNGDRIDDVVNENNHIEYEETDVPNTSDPDEEETEIPNTGTPDTGGLFRKLNISKEDYLITGLIVFFVFGVVAFGVVAKNRKNKR